MRLSSSNGTQLTIEELDKAWNLLHGCYLRIQEINDGSYNSRLNDAIQFDYCTCPELSHSVNNLEMIIKKISDVVYQEK